MKVYSIGREHGCDILINDNTDVISRRHAVLNVSPSGKMTIVDQSHNGTYVNGIRISPNVPVPVTRKDNISFAHVVRLDWNQVPKGNSAILRYVVIGVVALVTVIGGVVGYSTLSGGSPTDASAVVADTIGKADSLKNEQAKKDSIAKAKNDSIAAASKTKNKKSVVNKKTDVGKKVEKKTDNKKVEKKTDKEKKAEEKKAEEKKTEENKPKRLR